MLSTEDICYLYAVFWKYTIYMLSTEDRQLSMSLYAVFWKYTIYMLSTEDTLSICCLLKICYLYAVYWRYAIYIYAACLLKICYLNYMLCTEDMLSIMLSTEDICYLYAVSTEDTLSICCLLKIYAIYRPVSIRVIIYYVPEAGVLFAGGYPYQ